MKNFRADLHVHTVLSPCAGVEMIPPLIVTEALERGIHLIAITDHNSSANVRAVQAAAVGTELVVLPGMELQTREEVHILCLFDHIDQVETFQAWVDQRMPPLRNNPEFFGEQFIVDATGDFLRREERMLLSSVESSLAEAWQQVQRLGGWYIPAHVNRQAFGLINVLGLVPTDIPIDTLEISRHLAVSEAGNKFPQIKGYPLMQNGDVHYLEDFLGSMCFQVEQPTISELRQAIFGQNGRSVTIFYNGQPSFGNVTFGN